MRLPDTSLFTIIQLVMGSAMGIAGAALLFGLFAINQVPDKAMIAVCLICIAGKYLVDGVIQMMSAMSANVEDDIPVSDNIQEMVH